MTSKKILLSILFLGILTSLQAQNTLKGKVVDQENKPIDFAELHLLKENNEQLIQQGFTNETGDFMLQNISSDDYKLTIQYLGKYIYSNTITIDKDIDLQNIIAESTTSLEEIVVKTEKKLIERKADRLIFNTANSIASQGMDAVEALSNTPLIKVQNDKISIVGKSNVTIMINDRIVYLQGDALTNYLKTLRSDDIEKIEVITNPPAKYEASGNGGIINIVLKKNKRLGMYGTAGASYAYNNNNSGSANANLNYQTDKWNFMLKANGSKGKYTSENNTTFETDKLLLKSGNNPLGYYTYGGINLTTNYQVSEKGLIGITYDLSKSNGNRDKKNSSEYYSKPNYILDSIINSISKVKDYNTYQTANLFYDYKLDTLGNKVSLGVNYFSNLPEDTTNLNDYNPQNNVKNTTRYTNNLNYQVWSGTADVSYKLSWADLEFGGKYSNYDNRSKMLSYKQINNELVYDTSRSNRFNYKEDNIAGYISLNKKFNDKLNAKVGLRFEQTKVNGHLLETDEEFTKSYGKWFPSAYLSYDLNDNNSFSLNYSRRIQRPYLGILNPFKYYSNSYSYESGNPKLDPAFTDYFELNYLFNNALSIGVNYYHISNSFSEYMTYENNIFSSTYYNMLNADNYGLDLSYSNKITNWWQTNTGGNAYYSVSYYNKNISNQIPQNGITFSYYSQNTFTVNKAKTLNVFINWYHQLPNKEDNTKYLDYKTLSTGLKANLLNRKLNLNLTISDVFNTGRSSGTMYYTDNIQTYKNTWNSRRVTLSASYTFGDNSNKKSIKEASFDDKNRSNK